MTEVANLTAKIGFKISPTEFAQIRNTLKSLQQEIQKAVQEAARFANELTKISRGTGVSGRVVQQFRQLGISASVGANAMDSMLRSTSSLAQKSYWGFTNQLSQWGIYLTRSETAASALMKVMRGASGASPQRQREIFEAAGLPFEEAVLVLEQLQRSGFKLSDAIGMNDEELANMNRVSALIDKIKFNTEGFVNGLVGTQGDTFANGLEMVENVLGNVQKMILGIARDPGVKSGVANFLNFGALFTGFVTLTEKASDSFKGITQGVAFITKTAIWTTLIALLSRLFLGNRQKIAQTFKKAFPAGAGFLDSLFNSPMLLNAVKQAREKLKGVDFWGKEYLEDYLGDIENKGVFEATASRLDSIVDTLIDKLKAFWTTVYNGLLEVVKFAVQQITITLLTVWNEIKKGMSETAKGIFGEELQAEAFKNYSKAVADAIAEDFEKLKIGEKVGEDISEEISESTPVPQNELTPTVEELKLFKKHAIIENWSLDPNKFQGSVSPDKYLLELITKNKALARKWYAYQLDVGENGKDPYTIKRGAPAYRGNPLHKQFFDVYNERFFDPIGKANFDELYRGRQEHSWYEWIDKSALGAQMIAGAFGIQSSILNLLSGTRPIAKENLAEKGIYNVGGAPIVQISVDTNDHYVVKGIEEADLLKDRKLADTLIKTMGEGTISRIYGASVLGGDN